MISKLKNFLYALPIALSLLPGCSDDYAESKQTATTDNIPLISLETLAGSLGNRWESLPEESRRKFRRIWDISKEDEKAFLIELYQNPYKRYNSMAKSLQPIADNRQLSHKNASRIRELYPWFNSEELADRILATETGFFFCAE